MLRIKIILLSLLIVGIATTNGYSARPLIIDGILTYSSGTTSNEAYSVNSILEYGETNTMSGGGYSVNTGANGTVYSSLGGFATSVSPAYGYNVAPLQGFSILGDNFSSKPYFYISKEGESNIVGTSVEIKSINEISGNLNIVGVSKGFWSVNVSDESGNAATLIDAFEVKSYAYDQGVVLNTPNPFDPAREKTKIIYQLSKATDIKVVIYSTTADLLWSREYMAGSSEGMAGEHTIEWDGRADNGELLSNGAFILHIIEKGSNKLLSRGKIAIIRR